MTGADVALALVAVLFVLLAWVARIVWRLNERLARLEGRERNGRRVV